MFLPTLIYILIFRYGPMYGLIVSLFEYNPFLGISGSQYVGFSHFQRFLSGREFFSVVFRNTFILGFLRFVWTFPAPILLALLINEIAHIRIKKFVQSLSYLPHFVSITVVAGMTIMFLSPTNGIINTIIENLGGKSIYFLAKPELYRTIYIFTDLWQTTGWGSIIYLAAISAIDPQLYEAATLDGASKFRQIAHVTIPSIMDTIAVMFILSSGYVATIGFEKAFMLQNPLNYEASEVIATYVYTHGIVYLDFGYAAAVGLFEAVFAVVLLLGANYFSKEVGDRNIF